MAQQRLADAIREGLVGQVTHRQVHRHRHPQPAVHPLPNLDQCAFHDERGERVDQPGGLHQRHELVGIQPPVLRVRPADQRFGAHHLTGGQRDLRLVVHLDLAGVQRLPELGDQLESAQEDLTHRGGVAAHAVLAVAGRPHRHVGVLQQGVDVGFAIAVRRLGRGIPGDADGLHHDPVQRVRLGDRLAQVLSGLVRLGFAAIQQQHREGIRFQPGQRRLAEFLPHPLPGGDDHPVAPGVAEGLADGGEHVEVDPQHDGGAPVAQFLGRHLAESGAVEQAGQRIVVGVVTQPREQSAVVHRGRQVAGQGVQQTHVGAAEPAPPADPVVHFNGTEQLARAAQRHD